MNLIKRSKFALLMAVAILLPFASQAVDQDLGKVAPQRHETTVQICLDCAAACERCAAACLRDQEVKAMVPCIQQDLDCADMCRLCAQLIARDSVHASKLKALCATVCQACADECIKHNSPYCQDCAAACQKCADECKRMAK